MIPPASSITGGPLPFPMIIFSELGQLLNRRATSGIEQAPWPLVAISCVGGSRVCFFQVSRRLNIRKDHFIQLSSAQGCLNICFMQELRHSGLRLFLGMCFPGAVFQTQANCSRKQSTFWLIEVSSACLHIRLETAHGGRLQKWSTAFFP